ncbi:transposase [Actinomadura geliboluensis]|uniref:transposase n=1 Tax=Actinomadura geliboluensis TaxID=882440 RepID=UPI00148692BB
MIADKACSSAAIRRTLRQRGIAVTIPERVDQRAGRTRRGPHGGRPPVFDPALYRRRNVVERCIGRLKQWRAIATRADSSPATTAQESSWSQPCSGSTHDPPDAT